jgi:Reverse transcriptase (RNA-dependent DNA polymerase)
MSYWILTPTCRVVSRTTVQRVTNLERQQDTIISRCKAFDENISTQLKDEKHIVALDESYKSLEPTKEELELDQDYIDEMSKAINDTTIPHADPKESTADAYDSYLNMEVNLPRGDGAAMQRGRVTKRMKDNDGQPIGVAHQNPLLDTRVYEVEWLDGHREQLTANVVAENLFAQVDQEGNQFSLLDDIIDHRKTDQAILNTEAFRKGKSGMKIRVPTTKGWEICMQWKDGSTNWLELKDVKNAYPVQLAEYAIGNQIQDEPAFAWWVPHVMKKRKRILSATKSKYWLKTHKYGIEIPKSVEDARRIDAKNGDNIWWDAIMKEMKNVRIAFEKFKGTSKELPPGYQQINCHMIFDVKLGENFRRKARYVAGGHMTKPPASITYSSVVSRESVRIMLLIAALNDLEVLSADIQNAYLHAPCRERIWVRAGPEFGTDEGSVMLIVRALYGLKSSGAAFRSMLADHLHDMSFRSSRGDPDVWYRPAIKPDGTEYYEYILVYVDDIFAISNNPKQAMDQIQELFKFKNDEVKTPDMYLGAKLEKRLINGVVCWTMSSLQYVSAAIDNVEKKLQDQGRKLPTKCGTPMSHKYRPEEDISDELEGTEVTYYQELIGVLRWSVELGRVDIAMEVSMLSSHMALPRIGHLEQVLHIFGYLKQNPKKMLAFDPREPIIDENKFAPKADWHDFYRDAVEMVPDDAPPPRGVGVSIYVFVDSDHAANRITRRSQTGILTFLNRAPIQWFSKRQNTVESSTFGSEFIAMKTAVEMIHALRTKLRWLGVPLLGPANVFGDNESVVRSTQYPERTLTKKHNGIAYHKSRESVANGMMRVAHEPGETNLADLLTKTLARPRREMLIDNFMY